MNNVLRTLVYYTVAILAIGLGGFAVLENINSLRAVAYAGVTFLFVGLVLSLFESANKSAARIMLAQSEAQRDLFASQWTPEQFKQVKEDRLDREGYRASDDDDDAPQA